MELRNQLADCVKKLHAAGLCSGTGGNFSALIERNPLRVLMSPSGADKGELRPEDYLVVDENNSVIEGQGRPSAEALLHLAIYRNLGAGAVLHTHSVWNTLLSLQAEKPFIEIEGFEMLKALEGVESHEHRERIPVLPNSQDMPSLANDLKGVLTNQPSCHAILLAGHGLYTWGKNIDAARRHVEALEFLFEIQGELNKLRG